MQREVAPHTLTTHVTRGEGRLRPRVSFRGETYEGDALLDWLDGLFDDGMMTRQAHGVLRGLWSRSSSEGLSLRGERFVLLGAGAELAPTELLLAAGADVLWIDLRPPPASLLERDDLGGTLYVPEGEVNLLEGPAEILATVRAFAAAQPVHMGMYAYAGGQGQEWRLTASMNAILRSLSPDLVRSMALLVSPTTANAVTPEDREIARHRLAHAGVARGLLHRLGFLRLGHEDGASRSVVRSIVTLQGASYQAAQYVGKILAAEAHALHGPTLGEHPAPMRVSANVAPITATRSLSHPVFEAGFIGAPRWGILISEPMTTRHVAGWLTIADLTSPDAPTRPDAQYAQDTDRASALFSEQFHGGVGTQPYEVIDGIRFAAIQGMLQRPSLLAGLIRGR
jgi:hypothetical protein